MTPKERMLVALDGGMPDRLPVTTHFLMPHFLNASMGGMSEAEFFDTCGWDPIMYTTPHRPDPASGEYYDPDQGPPGFLESRRIASDSWRVQCEAIPGRKHPATRYRFVTPKGTLSLVLEADPFTAWVVEPLVKEKRALRGDEAIAGRGNLRPGEITSHCTRQLSLAIHGSPGSPAGLDPVVNTRRWPGQVGAASCTWMGPQPQGGSKNSASEGVVPGRARVQKCGMRKWVVTGSRSGMPPSRATSIRSFRRHSVQSP